MILKKIDCIYENSSVKTKYINGYQFPIKLA